MYLTKHSYTNETHIVKRTVKSDCKFKRMIYAKEGVYLFDDKFVYFNNKKLTNFSGKITHIISNDSFVLCADNKGSIKLLNEKVIKRFELEKEILNVQFYKSFILILDVEHVLYCFTLSENESIFQETFPNSFAFTCSKERIILCTEKELIFLNDKFKITKKIEMKNKKSKMFYKNKKIIFVYKNKVKIYDCKTKKIIKKEIHTKKIQKIELHSKFFYSFGKEGYIKKISYDLKILERYKFNKIIDFDFRKKLVYGTKKRKIIFLKEKSKYDLKYEFSPLLASYIKQHRYRHSLLTAFKGKSDTKLRIMKYLSDIDQLKCVLFDHTTSFLKDLLQFCIKHWDTSYKEVIVKFINFVFSNYLRFLPELKDEFEVIYQLVMDELYIQQELYILISYFEVFD